MNQSDMNKGLRHWLAPAAVLLSLAAARLGVVACYGNATPFWDQWDAEAKRLYLPWVTGNFDWHTLFEAHNEHRILTTRLAALGLFELGGRIWNPLLEMRFNALVHSAALALLLVLLGRSVTERGRPAFLVGAVAVLCLPFGWENTLAGFQIQFGLFILFSVGFLWGVTVAPPFTRSWWVAMGAGLLGPVTLASGALVLGVGALVTGGRYVVRGRQDHREAVAAGLLLAGGLAALATTPSVAGHAPLRAHSLSGFVTALATVASWPVRIPFGWAFLHLPFALYVVRLLKRREAPGSPRWFVVAVGIWVLGQYVSVAYGRASSSPLSSRYQDLFVLGLVVNLAALGAFADLGLSGRRWRLSGAAWAAGTGVCVAVLAAGLPEALASRPSMSLRHEANLNRYLCTGDLASLQGPGPAEIPYPDGGQLQSALDDVAVRSFLPGNIYEPNASRFGSPTRTLGCPPPIEGR